MRLAWTTTLCLMAVILCGGCGGKSDQAASDKQAPLVETYWQVVSVDGNKANPAADSAAVPHLIFKSKDKSLVGSGGVNRFFGTYDLPGGDAIRIRPGGVTRMAGPEPLMKQERRLLEMLQVINAYRIKGEELTLRANGHDAMKLRAVPNAADAGATTPKPTPPATP